MCERVQRQVDYENAKFFIDAVDTLSKNQKCSKLEAVALIGKSESDYNKAVDIVRNSSMYS